MTPSSSPTKGDWGAQVIHEMQISIGGNSVGRMSLVDVPNDLLVPVPNYSPRKEKQMRFFFA